MKAERKDTMYIYDKLSKENLPKIFFRDSRECFLDPYRQKLIIKTPEEIVRQKVASFFEHKFGVPNDMMRIEEPLVHFGLKSKDRADILIVRYEPKENLVYPLAVIECKAEDIVVDDSAIEQAVRYSNALGSDYFFVTNGVDLYAYKYFEDLVQYVPLEKIPTYKEMLGNEGSVLPERPIPPRTELNKLSSEDAINCAIDNYFLGADTSPVWFPYLINIFEAFLDVSHKISVEDGKCIDLIQDYGIRHLSYGNAGGGTFPGPYRSFIVNSSNGDTQFVSLAMFETCRTEKPDSDTKTAICVAVDNFDSSHLSLELNVDDSFSIEDGKLVIRHSGRITVGNLGSARKSDLFTYIEEHAPELKIEKNRVFLGELDMNELKYVDSPDMMNFIFNMIKYALVRDEFRAEFKKNHANKM